MQNPNRAPVPVAPKEDLIAKFLELQQQELLHRGKELELRKQSQEYDFNFAKASLEAQSTDLKDVRKHQRGQRLTVLIFSGVIVLFVGGFMSYCLTIGKDQIAMEIIKGAIFLLSGGAGGYALATKQSQKNKSEAPDEDE